MKAKIRHENLRSQAAKVRQIAQGIFDHDERRIVLRFVAASVKLSEEISARSP